MVHLSPLVRIEMLCFVVRGFDSVMFGAVAISTYDILDTAAFSNVSDIFMDKVIAISGICTMFTS